MTIKTVNLTIPFEQERLKALQYYAAKREISLQTELTDTLTRLYEKHVPAQTREYIESLTKSRVGSPE